MFLFGIIYGLILFFILFFIIEFVYVYVYFCLKEVKCCLVVVKLFFFIN